MNLRKISAIGLSACALLFSCNKETKLSNDDALNYAKEHFKLTEAPTPISGKLNWNFNNLSDEDSKTIMFENIVKPYVKDETYKASGSNDLNDDGLNNYKAICTEKKVSVLIGSLENYVSFYTNSSGFKIVADVSFEDSGNKGSYKNTSQYDSEGRRISGSIEESATISGVSTSASYSFSLSY